MKQETADSKNRRQPGKFRCGTLNETTTDSFYILPNSLLVSQPPFYTTYSQLLTVSLNTPQRKIRDQAETLQPLLNNSMKKSRPTHCKTNVFLACSFIVRGKQVDKHCFNIHPYSSPPPMPPYSMIVPVQLLPFN
jgi:hypothetical protein